MKTTGERCRAVGAWEQGDPDFGRNIKRSSVKVICNNQKTKLSDFKAEKIKSKVR